MPSFLLSFLPSFPFFWKEGISYKEEKVKDGRKGEGKIKEGGKEGRSRKDWRGGKKEGATS
jgi:hypothetical protein